MRCLKQSSTLLALAVAGIGSVATFTAGNLLAYESSRGPTELLYWDPGKAYSGYTFVRPGRVNGVYLIDMAGEVVNYWPDLNSAYLMDDGTLVGSGNIASLATLTTHTMTTSVSTTRHSVNTRDSILLTLT
jgi:hypothetical protein